MIVIVLVYYCSYNVSIVWSYIILRLGKIHFFLYQRPHAPQLASPLQTDFEEVLPKFEGCGAKFGGGTGCMGHACLYLALYWMYRLSTCILRMYIADSKLYSLPGLMSSVFCKHCIIPYSYICHEPLCMTEINEVAMSNRCHFFGQLQGHTDHAQNTPMTHLL